MMEKGSIPKKGVENRSRIRGGVKNQIREIAKIVHDKKSIAKSPKIILDNLKKKLKTLPKKLES